MKMGEANPSATGVSLSAEASKARLSVKQLIPASHASDFDLLLDSNLLDAIFIMVWIEKESRSILKLHKRMVKFSSSLILRYSLI
jgi:hypothetical protein